MTEATRDWLEEWSRDPLVRPVLDAINSGSVPGGPGAMKAWVLMASDEWVRLATAALVKTAVRGPEQPPDDEIPPQEIMLLVTLVLHVRESGNEWESDAAGAAAMNNLLDLVLSEFCTRMDSQLLRDAGTLPSN